MVEFLQNYWWIILIILGVITYFIWFYRKHGKEATLEEFRESVYKLMLAAEKQLEGNEEKFNWVVQRLHALLPISLKVLFTSEDLVFWVQKLYDEFKDFMDDGELNDSNKELPS